MADAPLVEAVERAHGTWCAHPDAAQRTHAIEALYTHWNTHGVRRPLTQVADVDVGALALLAPLRSAAPAVAVAACTALDALLQAPRTTRNTLTLVRSVAPAVLERTGDLHEKVARAAQPLLARLADAAYAEHDRGVREADAPHTAWERVVRDALAASAPRVRTHLLTLLPAVKARWPRMQVHPLLPALVDAVQAADGGVRAAARDAIATLWAAAPPAARSDLRDALDGAGVRAATRDALLADVDAARAPAPAPGGPACPRALADVPLDDVRDVRVYARHDLDTLFASAPFDGKETELNWQPRERVLLAVRGALKAGVPAELVPALVAHVRAFQEPVLKALASLRTTLALHAIHLVRQLALAHGAALEPTLDAWFVALVRMAGITKKLVASASQAAAATILGTVPVRAVHWHALQLGMGDKSAATRVHMCKHLGVVLAAQRRAALEAHGGLDAARQLLERALGDASAEVRSAAREAFAAFHAQWPTHAARVLETLPPAARKQTAAALQPEAKPAARSGPSSSVLAAKQAALHAHSPRLDERRPRASVWHPSLAEHASPARSDTSSDLLHGSPWRGAPATPETPRPRLQPNIAFASGDVTFSPPLERLSAEAQRAAHDATASASQLSGMVAQLRGEPSGAGGSAGPDAARGAPGEGGPVDAAAAGASERVEMHEGTSGPAEVHEGALGPTETPGEAPGAPKEEEDGVPKAPKEEEDRVPEAPKKEEDGVPEASQGEQVETQEAPKAEPVETTEGVEAPIEPTGPAEASTEPRAPPEVSTESQGPAEDSMESRAPAEPESNGSAKASTEPQAPAGPTEAAHALEAPDGAASPPGAPPAQSPAARYFLSRVAREDALAGPTPLATGLERLADASADVPTLRDVARRLAEPPAPWPVAPAAVLHGVQTYVRTPPADDVWALALIVAYRLVVHAYSVLQTHGLELAWLALVFDVQQAPRSGHALAHGASRAMLEAWAAAADPVLACDALRTAARVAVAAASAAEAAAVQTLAMHALGRLLARMPRAVLEDELPRTGAWVREVGWATDTGACGRASVGAACGDRRACRCRRRRARRAGARAARVADAHADEPARGTWE